MILSRRKLLGMLAPGAAVAPSLLLRERTIFLPPIGGWPHGRIAYASLIIPRDDATMYYSEEIASGRMEYDPETEVMSLIQPSQPGQSVTVETMRTPNEYVVAEDLISDEFGNFARGGAVPIRYSTGLRAQEDDAREKARMDAQWARLRKQYPSLPGDHGREPWDFT
jgi:hypothetical protein